MKTVCSILLAAASFTHLLPANLVITEVMSASGAPGGPANGDWFELTNTGTSAVNLGNYYWDDDGPDGDDGALFPPVSIAPGQSIIILDESSDNLDGWRSAWNISATRGDANYVTVLSKDRFGGPDDFSGLSSSGDQIGIWDADPNAGNANQVAAVTFGPATDGASFEWAIDGTSLGTSTAGENLATTNAEGDTGSPGKAVDTSGPIAPLIHSPLVFYGRVGIPIDFDGNETVDREIKATDPNFGDQLQFTTSGTPAWLNTADEGNGILSLTGTPAAAGFYSFDVTVTDNSASSLSTTETVSLYISGDNNPVLVNEYNAVDGDTFLNSGDAEQDSEGGAAADTFFGRVMGNGGDWLELVVVGYGRDADNDPATPVTPVADSRVDMRGWQIEIQSAGQIETIVLSRDAYWAAVPAGTLLTFIEDNTREGGLDTSIHQHSALSDKGYVWSNIWIHDPFYIDQNRSDFGGGIVIDNGDTQILIRDDNGKLVYGPAGEGVNPPSGIGSDEIFKLEQDPVPAVDTVFGNYQDGESSSFGAPNQWSGGNERQAFAAFQTANTPPQFGDNPVTVATGGTYSYPVSVSDPDGPNPTLTADQLPDFLRLNGNTLTHNRPLTLDDAGDHVVHLSVSDGTHRTPRKFILTVYNPAPSVILNEYNAVGGSDFLGGGDAAADEKGGNASDSFYGRIAGNGGDWFELVVVGDGSPGVTDLRGYQIQVGNPQGDGSFDVQTTLVLSRDPAWAAVRNGTILTFTEDNTANGGLDSGLNLIDNLTSEGWAWSNVWLGDTRLLDYTNEATNGYDLSALPEVSGLGIDEETTQFRILDASGRIVFGPAGEGIAPVSGIGSSDVMELEGDPSPAITPLDDATAGPAFLGYDDGASGSTFGAPNEWHQGSGGSFRVQDFSRFVFTGDGYEQWVGSYGITGSEAQTSADADGDGFTNLQEYLFGSIPTNTMDYPTVSMGPTTMDELAATVRTDDPEYTVYPQWSTDLKVWQTTDFTLSTDEPADRTGYRNRVWKCSLPQGETRFYRLLAD